MTRCRCAECGAVLAVDTVAGKKVLDDDPQLLVHPCGACMQEARADAVAEAQADTNFMGDEIRTSIHELEQEGRD